MNLAARGVPPLVTSFRWPSRRNRLRIAVPLALLGVVAFAAYFRRPLFEGNVGVVDSGRLIRSAQPTGDRLGRLARDHGLATVLNLRGGSDDDAYYRDEVADARRLGLVFYDLPMSATSRPPRKHLLWVLDLLDRCRYPLLIHCKSGSDRTGLVAGVYALSRQDQPPEVAERSLSLAFGHVPLLGTRRMHEPFREYAAWLKSGGLEHTPARFRTWVETEYQGGDAPFRFRPLPEGPRARWAARPEADDTAGPR